MAKNGKTIQFYANQGTLNVYPKTTIDSIENNNGVSLERIVGHVFNCNIYSNKTAFDAVWKARYSVPNDKQTAGLIITYKLEGSDKYVVEQAINSSSLTDENAWGTESNWIEYINKENLLTNNNIFVCSDKEETAVVDETEQRLPPMVARTYSHVKSFRTTNTEQPISGGNVITNDIRHIVCPTIDDFTTLDKFACGCKNMMNIDVSKWNTSNVNNLRFAFAGCFYDESNPQAVILDTKAWDLEHVKSMNYTFGDCVFLYELNTDYWFLNHCVEMRSTFQNCVNLHELNTLNWNNYNVAVFDFCFYNCASLERLRLDNWSCKPYQTYAMFAGCSSLKSLKFGDNWSNVNNTRLLHMFDECTELTDLYLGANFFNVPWRDTDESTAIGTTVDLSAVTKWSDESMRYSLIEKLFDRKAYGYTHTEKIILAKTVYDKLTSAEIAAIQNKNFVLEYK